MSAPTEAGGPGGARRRSRFGLQRFLDTGGGMRLALWLGKVVPPRVAYPAIRTIAFAVARRADSRMASAVKANLRVVLGEQPAERDLVRSASNVLFNSGVAGYQFFRTIGRGRDAAGDLIAIPPELFDLLDKAEREGRGLMAVTAHLGPLDHIGVAITATRYQVQVITYARPPAGYRIVNDLRLGEGLLLTPGSREAMVEAAERLEAGGIVFTALDRPLPERRKGSPVQFFGRDTRLWDGYARLALSKKALLMFVWAERTPEGAYRLRFNEPIDCADPPGDVTMLTRHMLQQAEDAIRAQPEQWLMFYPLWPDSGSPRDTEQGAAP